jgi:hypothetical protein
MAGTRDSAADAAVLNEHEASIMLLAISGREASCGPNVEDAETTLEIAPPAVNDSSASPPGTSQDTGASGVGTIASKQPREEPNVASGGETAAVQTKQVETDSTHKLKAPKAVAVAVAAEAKTAEAVTDPQDNTAPVTSAVAEASRKTAPTKQSTATTTVQTKQVETDSSTIDVDDETLSTKRPTYKQSYPEKLKGSFGPFLSPFMEEQHDTFESGRYIQHPDYVVVDRATYVDYDENKHQRLMVGDYIQFVTEPIYGTQQHQIFDFERDHIIIGPTASHSIVFSEEHKPAGGIVRVRGNHRVSITDPAKCWVKRHPGLTQEMIGAALLNSRRRHVEQATAQFMYRHTAPVGRFVLGNNAQWIASGDACAISPNMALAV